MKPSKPMCLNGFASYVRRADLALIVLGPAPRWPKKESERADAIGAYAKLVAGVLPRLN